MAKSLKCRMQFLISKIYSLKGLKKDFELRSKSTGGKTVLLVYNKTAYRVNSHSK